MAKLRYDSDTYEASDVVYNKVLMSSVDAVFSKSTDQLDKPQASGTSPSERKDELLQQSKAISLPLSSTISDNISNRPTSVLASSTQMSSLVQPLSKKKRKQKIKSKMTEEEIRRKMEKVLKSGEYKMKVGRLIFWDFGGQLNLGYLEKVETQRRKLYNGIEELFKDHEGRHHLVFDKHIFVNATDNTDSEIDILKETISDLTFEHPCWGANAKCLCSP
ncbi:unnamed protein product [Mytilus edulis]|uniref:Uncharacterized protein n=1 Tax=Mytilus edulis TaxID=6550 RepID=A0A8S3SFD7_MYTED|nr:unnamed protein product [Mytilus edulis]